MVSAVLPNATTPSTTNHPVERPVGIRRASARQPRFVGIFLGPIRLKSRGELAARQVHGIEVAVFAILERVPTVR